MRLTPLARDVQRPKVEWMKDIEAVTTRQKRWAELVQQQGQSKLSVSALCREHGVSDQSFYSWRQAKERRGYVIH